MRARRAYTRFAQALGVLATVALASGCSGAPPWPMDPGATPRFAGLCGTIGVRIRGDVTADHETIWRYAIRGGHVSSVATLPTPAKEATYPSFPYEPLAEAPPRFYSGPYLVSPSQQRVAATIHPRAPLHRQGDTLGVAILDWPGRTPSFEVKRNYTGSKVQGLAWSPDSRWLAVVVGIQEPQRSLDDVMLNSLNTLFGGSHPVNLSRYDRVRLDVFDASSGDLVAETGLSSPLKFADGTVVWTGDCPAAGRA